MPGYTPPSGGAVNWTLRDGYSVPAANAVNFSLIDQDPQYIAPSGIASPTFAAAKLVSYKNRTIDISDGSYVAPPSGYCDFSLSPSYAVPAGGEVDFFLSNSITSRFGRVNVSNDRYSFFPVGINDGAIGTPSVENALRYIFTQGFSAFSGFGFAGDGQGFVDFGVRSYFPAGFVATQFGSAELSGGVRVVDATPWDSQQFGTAFVADKERFIEPNWFVATQWGAALVGTTQTVTAQGFDAASYGAVTVFDNRKYAFLDGFDASTFGQAWVSLRVRAIRPTSFWSQTPGLLPERRWGRPQVYNLRQFIRQIFEVTPYDGGVFGNFNYVNNRNRVIGGEGWNSQRFPLTHSVENTGRAVLAQGRDSATFGGHLVAFRIRYLLATGNDTSIITRWHVVQNSAQVIALPGFDASRFGVARLDATRRFYDRITVGDQLRFGEPMVSYRVREIQQYYSYGNFAMPEPKIQLGRRHILPTGIPFNEVGAHTLEEKFSIILPRWTYRGAFGTESRVVNVTPEVKAFGFDQAEWGGTRIFNRWNFFPMDGFVATVFGRNAIEYRTKIVEPAGTNAFRITNRTRVRNIAPDPPSSQTVQVDGWLSAKHEGNVIVRGNVIYHQQESVSTLFGTARLINMAIGPCGGIYLVDQFGLPKLNPAQYIVQTPRNEPFTEYGKPRFSPHTVWASPAPAQALENHQESMPHWRTIDWDFQFGDDRPKFGQTRIEYKNRRVQQSGVSSTDDEFGTNTRVSNRRQRVFCVGTRHFRSGFPILNGGGIVKPFGTPFTEIGDHTVARYEDPLIPRRLFPLGFGGTIASDTAVSNFVRNVEPTGFNAQLIGEPRVHPPEPLLVEGFRADVYGTTWVSNRIRYVNPIGFESLTFDFVPGEFGERMRVSERHTITSTSANSGALIGSARVSNRIQSVVQAGEIIGSVSAARVSGQSYIALGGYGWDSSVFGDVQRWEAGKIKPYGDDMMRNGTARVSRVVRPTSIVGVVGDARVARPIRVNGVVWFESGGASVSHGDATEYTCGQLPRAIAVPPTQFIGFGTPTVQ